MNTTSSSGPRTENTVSSFADKKTTPSVLLVGDSNLTSDISSGITNDIVNSIGSKIPQYINQIITTFMNKLKQIPIFDAVITKLQNSDSNKLLIMLAVLFILSFLVPFEGLIVLNLIFTFIVIYKLQSKCFN